VEREFRRRGEKEKKKREEKWVFPVCDKTFVTAKKLKMKLKKNGKEVFNFAKKRLKRKEMGRKRWRRRVVHYECTHGATPCHSGGMLYMITSCSYLSASHSDRWYLYWLLILVQTSSHFGTS
jgi:hypothetical protein